MMRKEEGTRRGTTTTTKRGKISWKYKLPAAKATNITTLTI